MLLMLHIWAKGGGVLLRKNRVVMTWVWDFMHFMWNNNFILSPAGTVQRFKMLEIIWVMLEITFNVIVSSYILLLHFMS